MDTSQQDLLMLSVERLETAGLVTLTADDADGWFNRYSLTPDEADALADDLRAAAEGVRNA